MNMNAKEQSIFYDCQMKIAFVSSLFKQDCPVVKLEQKDSAGLFLIVWGVLQDLEAIENGDYVDEITG